MNRRNEKSPQSTGPRPQAKQPKYRKLGAAGDTGADSVDEATGRQKRPYQPQRQRRSIKVDRVDPRDLARMKARFFCDDCCHYSPSKNWCSMGYIPQHTRVLQMKLYNLTGTMAFCRFLEID